MPRAINDREVKDRPVFPEENLRQDRAEDRQEVDGRDERARTNPAPPHRPCGASIPILLTM